MIRYIIKRLFSGLVVLFIVSFITFYILSIIPGDTALMRLGTEATPELVAQLRASMGLDLPWYERYIHWIGAFLRGDWGESLVFGEDVFTLILQRLPVTITLAALSLLIAIPIATIMGVVSAIYQNRWIDYVARTLMQIGEAVPQFWLALIFLVVFAGQLGWFPVAGYVPFEEGMLDSLHSLLLPAIVISFGLIGILIRIIRSSMLTALQQDFMLMPKVNGLPGKTAIFKYAFRSALIAPVTTVMMQLAGLLTGTVLVESIFALPGIGRLLLVAVEQRDILLLQGLVMFITATVVLINFLADILYRLINPLIRLGGEESA